MIVTSAYRSPGRAARVRQATAPQPQPPPARRPRRHLHLGLAAGRVDRDRRAEGRLPRGQRQVDVDVAALDPVPGVRREAHDQVEVAGRRRRRALAALAGQPDALAVGDARPGSLTSSVAGARRAAAA